MFASGARRSMLSISAIHSKGHLDECKKSMEEVIDVFGFGELFLGGL